MSNAIKTISRHQPGCQTELWSLSMRDAFDVYMHDVILLALVSNLQQNQHTIIVSNDNHTTYQTMEPIFVTATMDHKIRPISYRQCCHAST